MTPNIDADIAAYAPTAAALRAEAEALELANMYHKLAMSEVGDEEPFAIPEVDSAQLPEGDPRRTYSDPMDRIGTGAECPTLADKEHMDAKAYNRRVCGFMGSHKPGTRFVQPNYFYDAEGRRVSR